MMHEPLVLIEVQENLDTSTREQDHNQAGSKKQELGLARWRSAVGLPEVLFDTLCCSADPVDPPSL